MLVIANLRELFLTLNSLIHILYCFRIALPLSLNATCLLYLVSIERGKFYDRWRGLFSRNETISLKLTWKIVGKSIDIAFINRGRKLCIDLLFERRIAQHLLRLLCVR
jgi:hypothetical protein